MPGPLPDPNRRRRNAPTIPTTKLAASGRATRAPRPPKGYDFGERARAWWAWAWKLPQALAWSDGDLYALARRAQLEDDLRALEYEGFGPPPDCSDEMVEYLDHVKHVVERLKAMAAAKLAVIKEARELDDRFGLTPKGFAALRWTIVEDASAEAVPAPNDDRVARIDDRRRRLSNAS